MRIDHLKVENFKLFEERTFDFAQGSFHVLIGDNGSGKTSALDALAVALGIWHKAAPGSGWRNILSEEILSRPVRVGDRVQFVPHLPARISAVGSIGARAGLSWTRQVREGGIRTTNAEARDALVAITHLVREAAAQRASLPVLAYYGAGRAWLPANTRPSGPTILRKTTQLDAYRHCLDARLRDKELNEWFLFETAAMNGGGSARGRPGYRAIKEAILECIPEADGLRYDADLKEIVLSICGSEQPFYRLSAGQRSMLALVADIAIKAVTLNAYLLSDGAQDPTSVLKQSPGVVLIDELDVHLHPKWQRRVARDLKRTFPSIQFICTSHSPQVVGELKPHEVMILEDGQVSTPGGSFGIDSSRILEEVMEAPPRSEAVGAKLKVLFGLIDTEDFDAARTLLPEIEADIGSDDPELTRARTLISFMEAPCDG